MKYSLFTYIFLGIVLLFGIILWDYAFPEMNIQKSIAANLSVYCFSFFTSICIVFGLKDINNKK
jgi:hypothetical protein